MKAVIDWFNGKGRAFDADGTQRDAPTGRPARRR